MYRQTPESITTRGDLDRALVAEERASRLAAELDDLRMLRDLDTQRINEWYHAADQLRKERDALRCTVWWLAWMYQVALTGIGLLKGREAARDAVTR